MNNEWDAERARQVLLRTRDEMARGRGLSNRTLGRLAALSDESAAASKRAFVCAMEKAGCSRRRINRAYALALPERAVRKVGALRRTLRAIEVAAQSQSALPLPFLLGLSFLFGWATGPIGAAIVLFYVVVRALMEPRR